MLEKSKMDIAGPQLAASLIPQEASQLDRHCLS
jgi:hypothetical protein